MPAGGRDPPHSSADRRAYAYNPAHRQEAIASRVRAARARWRRRGRAHRHASTRKAVAISLDWLAQAKFFQKRYADAEADLRHAVAVAEKSSGPQSQLVVVLLDHLIAVVKTQGREQDAAVLTERAQKILAEAARSARRRRAASAAPADDDRLFCRRRNGHWWI